MKIILLLLSLLMFPISVNAADNYFKNDWHTEVQLTSNIEVKSKFAISEAELKKIHIAFINTKNKFESFMNMNLQKCEMEKVKIRIIGLDDLSNQKYFPNEREYSDPPDSKGLGMFVLGRYFKYNNHLYLAPEHNHVFWRVNVAHELAHYFFDECNVHFASSDEEHNIIYKFEKLF